MTSVEALDDLLPRVAHLQKGLEQWQELVERLTAGDRPLDPGSIDFVLWAIRSLARNLVAIDTEVEEFLAVPPEIPTSTVAPIELAAAPGTAER
jgi:hypothetical protein